jgi:putative SOS response-associated peptidase YedK
MCYNYEALVRREFKRSIREVGKDIASDQLNQYQLKVLSSPLEDLFDSWSAFPGSEVVVFDQIDLKPEFYFFGYLAPWVKEIKQSNLQFNARSESLVDKPTWKKSWSGNQRCVALAKGFYETDRNTKNRYFFSLKDDQMMYLAGIYNHWANPETGEIIKTMAIITTTPNELVKSVHDRMPVIIEKDQLHDWLNVDTDKTIIQEMLQPLDAAKMTIKELPNSSNKIKTSQSKLDF